MKKPFVLLTAALAASVCFALTQTLVEGESLGDAIAAANQVYDATDVEAHGLGATTVLTTTERLIRNLAKMDWRLAKGAPAIDAVPTTAVADPPTSDLYGLSRPRNGAYDIGCMEYDVKGLLLFVR